MNRSRSCQMASQDRSPTVIVLAVYEYSYDSHSHQCFLESAFLSTANLVKRDFQRMSMITNAVDHVCIRLLSSDVFLKII